MATAVIMPKQGQTVETCTVVDWKKKVGDSVKTSEVVCEIETDKATFEVESPAEGTLLAIFHPAGAVVPVLTPIAAIGKPGENIEEIRRSALAGVPEASGAPASGGGAGANAAAAFGAPGAASRAAVVSSAPGAASRAAMVSSAPGAASRAAMVLSAPGAASRAPTPTRPLAVSRVPAVSPRARALAAARGIDVSGLTGSGPGGRIIERDVLAALEAGHAAAPAGLLSKATAMSAASGKVTEIPIKGVRKIIAERMLASLQSTAQLTLNCPADARALLDLRRSFKDSPEAWGLQGVTINDLVHFAVARTLLSFPDLNSTFDGSVIRQFADVHLAFAIDTQRGLMVPVIRNAQTLSLRQLSAEAARLAHGCREGGITPDELSGGTFTVTNLGALGIESFTPVLNTPQVAILGVCAIQPRPLPAAASAQSSGSGTVTFVPHLGLSLTINHQVVDGAPGARFLQALAQSIAALPALLAQ